MAGRPREFDRDEALEKARNLFWRRGYEAISFADLQAELRLAPARIYAAFGSKEDLFRAAVDHYRNKEGGFASRALAEEPTAHGAIERLLRDAVSSFYLPGRPLGCMVVSAATNCAKSNEGVLHWLAELRLERIEAIADRLRDGITAGELRPETDVQVLADYYAAMLNGLSVQARDGVPKRRLLAFIPQAMKLLEANLAEPIA
ncbi:TetR/AcrR family transcriptional regulator [Nitratireductor thuwali]|uniref:HTH-type transcriptional repressor ComR n=1 Tax=Nitratireductor thuwali TaxID=2267699 RepID=A0ABY5MJ39_9HYPH|nr:HTH-type transcriptional repressor ComR [Nitratireductor thuwali]